MTRRVLSIGQCDTDDRNLGRAMAAHFDVTLDSAATEVEAVTCLREKSYALVLVNRIFDLSGASGLDFIRQLQAKSEYAATPVMLVSNFVEAQREAVTAGAVPGFGKADLNKPAMMEALRAYLT